MSLPVPAMPERGRLPPYRSLAGIREGLRAGRGMLVLALVVACTGCAGLEGAYDDPMVETGSVPARQGVFEPPIGKAPEGVSVSDWRMATLALDEALKAPQIDTSISWENPITGARGTSTPIGAEADGQCRDFMIAILAAPSADRWVSGQACRGTGKTVLSDVRMLERS